MRPTLFMLFIFTGVLLSAQPDLPPILPDNENDGNWGVSRWEEMRKPEIKKLFLSEVYGMIPTGFNPVISYTLSGEDKETGEGGRIRKQVIIHLLNEENGEKLDINLLVYLPSEAEYPVPIFLGLNFYGNHTISADPGIIISDSWVRNNDDFHITNNQAGERSRAVRTGRWPVEYILSRGYGLATIYYGDIDPDYDDNFHNGLHRLFRKEGKYPDDWAGSIAAWAYGLSLAMDYFETDSDVNEEKVVVFGHSRLGKTALLAGALDERFAMVISNDSGCGGAALSSRKHGETVKKINESFPHWFCRNFRRYNENEEQLPVDQHMLLALIAPRPLYVASAEEDDWADPYGEQLSASLAGEIYELYTKKTFIPEEQVALNKPVKIGFTGYHIRSGKHDITRYDWEQYLDFADLHVKNK